MTCQTSESPTSSQASANQTSESQMRWFIWGKGRQLLVIRRVNRDWAEVSELGKGSMVEMRGWAEGSDEDDSALGT